MLNSTDPVSSGVLDELESLLSELAHAPSRGSLVSMPASTFAALVGYLFTCAGYTVEDAGTQLGLSGVVVGLNLFADASRRHLLARVEAHQHRPDRALDAATLAALGEPLRERSADGVPGFVITTSGYARRAYDAD